MMGGPEITTAKGKIEQAFLELLDEKSYPDITVTDIIQKADVARATYYRNFNSVSDIVDSITDNMVRDFLNEIVPMFNQDDERSLREFLFNYYYRFKQTYQSFCPGNRRNKSVIMSQLHEKIRQAEHSNHIDSIPEKYSRVAKFAVLDGIARKWGNDGFIETTEEVIDYAYYVITSF